VWCSASGQPTQPAIELRPCLIETVDDFIENPLRIEYGAASLLVTEDALEQLTKRARGEKLAATAGEEA